MPSVAPYFLKPFIGKLSEKHPEVELVVHECLTGELLQMVETYKIDLAIVSLPLQSEEIEKQILLTEEIFLAVPLQHPLAAKDKIRPCDLEKERLILMREGCALTERALTFCLENSIRPKEILRGSQMETVHSLVTAGLGVAFVPRIAKLQHETSLVYRSFQKPKPNRTVVAIWKKDKPLTPVAVECLKHFEETSKSLLQSWNEPGL